MTKASLIQSETQDHDNQASDIKEALKKFVFVFNSCYFGTFVFLFFYFFSVCEDEEEKWRR